MEFIAEFILDFFGETGEMFLDKHLPNKTSKLLFYSLLLVGFVVFIVARFLK